jgi:hypothetical protein
LDLIRCGDIICILSNATKFHWQLIVSYVKGGTLPEHLRRIWMLTHNCIKIGTSLSLVLVVGFRESLPPSTVQR